MARQADADSSLDAALEVGGPSHLVDGILTIPLFSAVIIPIVVEFGKRLADKGADLLVDWARKKLELNRHTEAGILTDDQIDSISRFLKDFFSYSK
jgi:hypothetical protein